MFLGANNIRARLAKGDLQIDPLPQEEQLSAFAVDLRLGTQFAQFPAIPSDAVIDLATRSPFGWAQEFDHKNIPLGERFVMSPGSTVLAVTLEYVYLPSDLAGLLYPRSALQRFGLSVGIGTIDPGFQGKLTLFLSNVGTSSIALYPGLRVTRLCLVVLSGATSQQYQQYQMSDLSMDSEIRSVKAALEHAAPRPAPSPRDGGLLARRLSEVLNSKGTKGTKKGRALEELMADIFTSLVGLRIVKRNARLRAEELDLVINNDLATGFWRLAGSPLVVECKNWSVRVGAREISVLVDKLRTIGPDAKTGVLVALNGISGDSYSDAVLKIREARQAGRYILVLERRDLEELADGTSLAVVIERKYEEMLMI
jgi:dCTP deaminase